MDNYGAPGSRPLGDAPNVPLTLNRLEPLDGLARHAIIDAQPCPDNSSTTIEMLERLISDPVTSPEARTRIHRLLGRFLGTVGHQYRVEHLALVSGLLEFLATRATSGEDSNDRDFKIYLQRMVKLCELPPLLGKTSDRLRCSDGTIERYLAALGHLATILPADRDISGVLGSLHNSLVGVSKDSPVLELGLCREAIEKSGLATIVARLSAEVSSPEVYRRVLELALVLTNVSNSCCYAMLNAGILDHLFGRMKSDEPNEAERENAVLATNVLWSIMKSILPPRKHTSTLTDLPTPSIEAMRRLRDEFRYRVIRSRGNIEIQMLRNDLASLILAGLAADLPWGLVGCGLAEDLVVLSLIDQFGIEGTWTEALVFDPTEETLIFRKLMLTVLCHLSRRGEAIAIMTGRGVMPAILEMINPTIDRKTNRWNRAEFSHLSRFALRTLAQLGSRIPEEFTQYEGSARLSSLVEWSLSVEFDADFAMEFTKTICSLSISECPLLVRDLGEGRMAAVLLKLVDRILGFGSLDMRYQRIATLAIISIAAVTRVEESVSDRCDYQSLATFTRLLNRCLDQKPDDFPLDERLLIAIGSSIWDCVVGCSAMSDRFVDGGGIYAILDAIEMSGMHVRCIYLGILTDLLASNRHATSQFCTWRGADGSRDAVSLLAETWRQEETRSGVKRTKEGCIDDVEVPIMPTEEWINASHARAPHDSSPALASVFATASVRPKIYALRKIMTNEAERYRESRERYGLSSDRLSLEDHLTVLIADHFYRFAQGQTWFEVSRYLEQIGVNMLGMDGEIALLMNQRHREWGMYVRRLQEELLRSAKRRESELEREEMKRMRDTRVMPATLSVLRDIDYVRRTTEHDYMLARKESQRLKVNDCLRFPDSPGERHYHHRTFNERWNFTVGPRLLCLIRTILEQNHTIPSACAKPLGIGDTLEPLSPTISRPLRNEKSKNQRRKNRPL